MGAKPQRFVSGSLGLRPYFTLFPQSQPSIDLIMAKKKKVARRSVVPRKSPEVLVTSSMLNEARHELKAEITSFRLEVDARFKQVDARFNQVDSRFKQVDARFDQMDASISQLSSNVEKVLAAVHRVGLLVEEQNARNKFVLDGYVSLSDRLDKVEKKSNHDL